MPITRSRCVIAALTFALLSAPAAALETRYPAPTRDGKERITRTGSYSTGYVGKGDECEAIHRGTARAYPYILSISCPSGTFRSGDACKAFR